MSRVLDRCAISEGIAEWHTQLNDIGSACGCRQYKLYALCCRWITAHKVGNEYASLFIVCMLEGVRYPGCW